MISEESVPMMIMSSIYTISETQPVDIFRRKKEESYLLCSKENCRKVNHNLLNKALGACFNKYKDNSNLHTSHVGDENKPGEGFIKMSSLK